MTIVVYCPKCGSEVSEEMSFCPKCGAAIKAGQITPETRVPTTYRRSEKAEKEEKDEKNEKGEKHEKREYGFLGPLIGGVVLMLLGLTAFLEVTGYANRTLLWAVFFVIVGVIVIIGAIYGATLASRRHPRT